MSNDSQVPLTEYDRGLLLMEQSQWAEAIEAFESAIQGEPDTARYYHSLSTAYMHLDEFDKARSSSEEAVRLDPNNPDHHYGLGRCLRGLGLFDEAISVFDETLRRKPTSVSSLSQLGYLSWRLGRYERAIGYFNGVLTHTPDNIEVLRIFADCHYKQGEFDRAAEIVGRIPDSQSDDEMFDPRPWEPSELGELDPEDQESFRLAILALRALSPEDTVRTLRSLVERYPDLAYLHHDLGLALTGIQQFGWALRAFARARELDETHVSSLLNGMMVGRQLFSEEPDFEETAAKVERAIERDDFDEAEAALRRYSSTHMYSYLSDINRCYVHILKGEYARAIELGEHAIFLDPERFEAYAHLGLAYRFNGEERRGLEYLQRSLDINPDNPEGWLVFGREAFRQAVGAQDDVDLFDLAIQASERILQSDPSDARALFLRGQARGMKTILVDREHPSAALADLKRAVELDPENIEYREVWDAVNEQLRRHTISEAEAADQETANARNEAGRALLRERRHTDALQVFQDAVQEWPNHYLLWCNLGFTLCKLERWKEASESLEKTIALEPQGGTLADPYYHLGVAYRWLNRNQDAMHVLEKALQICPEDSFIRAEAHVELGKIYVESGDREEADEAFQRATDAEPGHREAIIFKGMIAASRDQHQTALEHYTKVAYSDGNALLGLYTDQYRPPFTFGRIPTRVSRLGIDFIDLGARRATPPPAEKVVVAPPVDPKPPEIERDNKTDDQTDPPEPAETADQRCVPEPMVTPVAVLTEPQHADVDDTETAQASAARVGGPPVRARIRPATVVGALLATVVVFAAIPALKQFRATMDSSPSVSPSPSVAARIADGTPTQGAETPSTAVSSATSPTQPIGLDFLLPQLKGGESGVYVITGPGRPPLRIGDGSAPSWSPDGSKLAFIDKGSDGLSQLFLYDTSSQTRRQLTTTPGAKGHPTWSPSGDRIAYSSHETGHYEIFLCNTDGADARALSQTSSEVNNVWPSWSPDGKWIAFRSDRDGNNEIYVTSVPDGSTVNISRSPAVDVAPTWMPNGERIVWASDRAGTFDIYSATTSGGDVRRLTQGERVVSPTVSWDGRYVCGTAARRFMICDQNGRVLDTIESDGARLRSVVWSSHGERVAYSRSFPTASVLRTSGRGSASVLAGPYPTAARATREAWSLEISGYYSRVDKKPEGWVTTVGEHLSPDEAHSLADELGRAQFSVHRAGGA